MKMMMGGGMMGGGMGKKSGAAKSGASKSSAATTTSKTATEADPAEKERIDQFRRRYKTALTAIQGGLGAEAVRPQDLPRGLARLASGKPEAAFVTAVSKNIADQVKVLDKDAKTFRELDTGLKPPIGALAKLIADEPGAAASRPAPATRTPAKTPADTTPTPPAAAPAAATPAVPAAAK